MRPWTDEALCAQAPHDELTWVIEPGNGIEPPGTVAKLLEVCRECEVRAECLRDALQTTEFDVFGCWGGIVRSERGRVLGVQRNSDEFTFKDTRGEHVEHAYELLFDTLPNRISGWRHLAELDRAERARGPLPIESDAPDSGDSRSVPRLRLRSFDLRARVAHAMTRSVGPGARMRGSASGRCRQAAYRYRATSLAV